MAAHLKGFSYVVTDRQIREYRTWSIARRLQWLLAGNKLRRALPDSSIVFQNAFRKGKI